MLAPSRRVVAGIVGAVAAVLAAPATAHAYVGPSPEFFGYFAGLAGWLCAAFSAMLVYPLYALRRWLRGGDPLEGNAGSADQPVETDAGDGAQ